MIEAPELFEMSKRDHVSARQNRQWGFWEVGQLLDRLNSGDQINEVARDMNRTPAGVRRMYERLLDGDIDLSDDFGQNERRLLKEIRLRFGDKRGGSATLLMRFAKTINDEGLPIEFLKKSLTRSGFSKLQKMVNDLK